MKKKPIQTTWFEANKWSFVYTGLNEINYYDESDEEKYREEANRYYREWLEENKWNLVYTGSKYRMKYITPTKVTRKMMVKQPKTTMTKT